MKRATVILATMCLLMAAMTSAVLAEEPEMDPLLKLLVEQGVITLEQAQAVQVEYDKRKAAAATPAPEAPKAAEAAPPAEVEKTESKTWTDRMTVLGDVRLRYEGFNQDGGFYNDRRDRFRIRLRAGLKAEITEWMTFGMELRNGDPNDPVSNNTSFDGGFQFKEFNLAQGYVDVQATDWLGLIGGKFDAKKRWTVSDFQWDDDVTVEGFMENFQLATGDGAFRGLQLATYQYLLEESKTDRDSYTFGGQMRSDFKLGSEHSLGLGAGFDYWRDPQKIVDLTLSGQLGGNKVTNFLDENDMLISDFEILNLFAEYKFAASKRWPVKFNLFYYKNLGAKGIGKDNDTGTFGRVQIGDYKSVGQIAARYSYYYSEPDAVFYVFTQSDTSRSSDLKAHRFDLRIGFYAKSYFNITWYNTRPAYREDEPLNRWQMDYIIKF